MIWILLISSAILTALIGGCLLVAFRYSEPDDHEMPFGEIPYIGEGNVGRDDPDNRVRQAAMVTADNEYRPERFGQPTRPWQLRHPQHRIRTFATEAAAIRAAKEQPGSEVVYRGSVTTEET